MPAPAVSVEVFVLGVRDDVLVAERRVHPVDGGGVEAAARAALGGRPALLHPLTWRESGGTVLLTWVAVIDDAHAVPIDAVAFDVETHAVLTDALAHLRRAAADDEERFYAAWGRQPELWAAIWCGDPVAYTQA